MELKKCPFCGGKAKTVKIRADYIIYCEICKARTAPIPNEKEAETLWNIRARRINR